MNLVHAAGNEGIVLDNDCLKKGTCELHIYETLNLRSETGGKNNAEIFTQDVILSATFFIGTMVTIGLLVSGFMMVFGGANEEMYKRGVRGLKFSLIALLLVIVSYSLVRVISLVAQGAP